MGRRKGKQKCFGDLTFFLLEPPYSFHGFQGEDTSVRYFRENISRSPKTIREDGCFEVGLQAAFLNAATRMVFDQSFPFQLLRLHAEL